MIDEVMKKAVDEQGNALRQVRALERYQKDARQLADLMNAINVTPSMKRVTEDLARQEEMLRSVFGPLEEFYRSITPDDYKFTNLFNFMQGTLDRVEVRFQLPKVDMTAQYDQGVRGEKPGSDLSFALYLGKPVRNALGYDVG